VHPEGITVYIFVEERLETLKGTLSPTQKYLVGFKVLETPAFTLFLLGLFFTLKMKAICSSETSVDYQRTTRRHIPEDILFDAEYAFILQNYITRMFCESMYCNIL
jgi:hypothetical protein